MRIVHRIGFRPTPSQRAELEALGVKVPVGSSLPGERSPLVTFDVAEDHPNWRNLCTLLGRWQVSDFVTTEFSQQEIDSAPWIEIGAWHHGYPQPENEFGYLRATCDLTEWCDTCGIGLKQKAPFRMKGEPKWGRRSILQLNWVFDELFVTPEIWSSVFDPHGVGCRPVTNTKGVELNTVVQIVVEEEVGIATEGLAYERCTKCGRVKYLPVTRSLFPALTTTPTRSMVKTREYFGSGAAAHKRVLISQDLARSLSAGKVRGASFWPVQSANSAS